MAFDSARIARIKNYYLKGVLAIYIVAFASLYVQVQSLFGDNGIVPLRDFMSKLATPKGPLEAYNIVSFAPKLGLSYGTFLELLCIIGVLLAFSALLLRRFSNALSFGLLWYLYYSICSLGQGFMSFHSDLLLLEVGFITILIAPLLPTSSHGQADHDHVTFFLIRWLTFRYFVSNVLNVYLDGDKAWYNMTAIPMVAQGVQFPSLFSWHIFNFSPELIKLYQAYEHSVKLCAPFLLLLDLKFARFIGFYTLLFVAVPSALFFNFGWTDLLISVCLLSFLKDYYFYNDKRAKQSTLKQLLDYLVVATYVAVVGFLLVKFYGFKYVNNQFKSQVLFTPSQFKLFTDHLVPVSLVFGSLGLLSSAHTTFFKSSSKTSIIKTLVYTSVAVGLFLSTFPTLMRFSPGLENKIKPLAFTKNLNRFVAPYSLSNNYILLSKVSQHYGEGRPELQLQVRESPDDPTWQQLDLRYKPGLSNKGLARVIPHLPRVDLKMWYAARSSLQNNQWLQTFAYRVATKEKSVGACLAAGNPLLKVSQIRIALLNYKYSKQTSEGYWSQTKFRSEYMPTTTVENLKFSVKSNGISLLPATKSAEDSKVASIDQLLNKYLEISSNYIRGVDPTAVIWTLSAIAAVSMLR